MSGSARGGASGCTLRGKGTFFPMIRRGGCSKDGVLVVLGTEERSTNRWRSAEVPLRGTRNQGTFFFLPRVDVTAPHVGSVETIRFVQRLTSRVGSQTHQDNLRKRPKETFPVSHMSSVAQLLSSMVPLSSPVMTASPTLLLPAMCEPFLFQR